jgi:hypothetical protein
MGFLCFRGVLACAVQECGQWCETRVGRDGDIVDRRVLQKPLGVAAELEQSVEETLVLQRQRSDLTRQCEDGMDITRGQKIALSDPVQACVRLASWEVPVAARVIGDGGVPAVAATIAMAAECSGRAARDRVEHPQVLAVDPAMAAFDEAGACVANDVGHLQRRAAQSLSGAVLRDESVS